ncbi:6-pyruvoyl trahydropterin synthase family protein [Haloarcula sp. GH36]|uniref:6-pyruvoyl trahydropterin synthase family protein n=1 Tax=Haloarcula montana TaxID=3111776 RepID=UPI002D7966CD|nr:6-carboxytetrahydropterin synthase [Haloarcula sp. GH36]
MYELSVSRDFVAQHYLTVPNPGPEGEIHSHHYEADVRFAGPELNDYGYLVDIDDIEAVLDALADRYRDELLNDLPAFEGNPSVERFARIFADEIARRLDTAVPERLTVRLWEDDVAWASYERSL